MFEPYEVGTILKANVLIMRKHEWPNYYDLEVVDRDTGENGHVRINK